MGFFSAMGAYLDNRLISNEAESYAGRVRLRFGATVSGTLLFVCEDIHFFFKYNVMFLLFVVIV